jgi:NAD+ diphosphatase
MTNSNDMPLAAKPIERAAHRRLDEAWLEDAFAHKDTLVLVMRKGEPFVLPGRESGLVWLGPEVARVSPGSPRLFLGEDKNGTPVFAVNLPDNFALDESLLAGAGEFRDFRVAAASIPDMDANCASTARSIFMWHQSHRYCSKCGSESAMVDAGWKRQCPACGTEHFPRTDPVAIMLAEKDGMALIGRQKMWPAGFYSCLAGFCEPGETIEQAAAREIFEEAGITVDPATAQYVACQPWPFPSSLMVGLILEASTNEIHVDEKELETARWVSREEMVSILDGTHGEIFGPPPMAIAHHIMKAWTEKGH